MTLKFARGATRIFVHSSLAPGASDSYILGAGAGQPVVLTAHAVAGSDPSLVITSLPDGAVLQPDSPARSAWTTVLSKSQELLVQPKNPGPATAYELSVMVPALVKLPAGGGTVTRSGSTPAGLPVDYVVAAQAGQTLEVSLESAGSGAMLQTTGFVSGSDYVAVNGLSNETPSNRLQLAPSTDRTYVVSVLPPRASDVRYRLVFTLRPGP